MGFIERGDHHLRDLQVVIRVSQRRVQAHPGSYLKFRGSNGNGRLAPVEGILA